MDLPLRTHLEGRILAPLAGLAMEELREATLSEEGPALEAMEEGAFTAEAEAAASMAEAAAAEAGAAGNSHEAINHERRIR